MNSSGTSAIPEVGVPKGAAGAFTSVLSVAVGMVTAKLEQKAVALTRKLNETARRRGSSEGTLTELAEEGLDELAEGGGAAKKAGAEGLKAGLQGANPIWPAIKGAWHAGSPVVKAAIITAAASTIVLLLVSPVLLLIFLLSWLIIAAARSARSAPMSIGTSAAGASN